MKPLLTIRGLAKAFESQPVIEDLDFALAAGEIVSILGPSGCGKTTILRLVAGFEVPDAGEIEFAGQVISQPGRIVEPDRRSMGMVFQDPLLFPHLTVTNNLAFGLKNWSRGERKQRIAELIDLLGLTDLEGRYPHQLSGGQRQRVSLGRALARRPALLLLDEPFCNLDVALRQQLRQEVVNLLRETGTPTLLVTHDQEEALSVSDRLAVLSAGQVEQEGEPDEIFFRPRTRFVARFVGIGSFLPIERTPEGLRTEIGLLRPETEIPDGTIEAFIRPDLVKQAADNEGFPARVLGTTFYGCQRISQLSLPSGHSLLASFPSYELPRTTDVIRISADLDQAVVFGAEESQPTPSSATAD